MARDRDSGGDGEQSSHAQQLLKRYKMVYSGMERSQTIIKRATKRSGKKEDRSAIREQKAKHQHFHAGVFVTGI